MAGNVVDRSFAHCVLCLESGHQMRGTIQYCGGTTNLTNYLRSCHNELEVVNSWTCQSSIMMTHYVDDFQIDSTRLYQDCTCIMLYNKDKEKIIISGFLVTAMGCSVLAQQQNLKMFPALVHSFPSITARKFCLTFKISKIGYLASRFVTYLLELIIATVPTYHIQQI